MRRRAAGRFRFAVLVVASTALAGPPALAQAAAAPTGMARPDGSAGVVRFLVDAPDSTVQPREVDPAGFAALSRSIVLNLRGATRAQAVAEIGRAGAIDFVYASDLVPRSGSVDIASGSIAVSAALRIALAGLSVDVMIEPAGTIVLKSRGSAAMPAARPAIRVQLTDQVSHAPVEGALLSLIGAGEAVVDQGITNVLGVGVLVADTPGSYRIRVRRIGYRPVTSDPVTLDPRDTTRLPLAIPSIPVALPAVTTAVKPKACRRGDGEQLASSAMWDQIRIALESSELTTADTSIHTLRRTFIRGVPSSGVAWIDSASQSLGWDRPYATARAAADLSLHGYVTTNADGSQTVTGPDARVLLSPSFENDHCFTVTAGSGSTAGLLGLAFTPISDRTLADVAGVLWVAPPSGALEYVEYHYVNVHAPRPAPDAGGRIVFERARNGEWIVRDWFIHTPSFGTSTDGMRDIMYMAGYRDVGGSAEVVAMGPVAPAPSGDLAGQADQLASRSSGCPDSTTLFSATISDTNRSALLKDNARGLPGAVVQVSWFAPPAAGAARPEVGLSQVGVADESGVARLCLLHHAGTPIAIAYAARLTSAPVSLAGGPRPIAAVILMGGPATIVGRLGTFTPPVYPPRGSSRISLTVRDSAGAPVQGASVEISGWQYSPEATNRSGRLSVGDLPTGTTIIDVWRPGYLRQRLAVDLTAGTSQSIDITLAKDAPAGDRTRGNPGR